MQSPKLSQLAETLIGSEIVKLGGEIKERIRQGARVYNFTVGDFDPSVFPIPAELQLLIEKAYQEKHTNYPMAEGNLDLRQALRSFIKHYQGLDYETSEILVASGGRPLIYTIFRTLCDPGDKIVYAVPSWNNNHYTHFVEGEHRVVEATAENNFMPTAAELQPHLAGAILLALCSPQNPTGTTFRKEELEAICDRVLEENAKRGDDEKKLYVMFDQMYWHLTYGSIEHHDPVSLRPEMKAYTIYVDAISKVFSSTGLRVGWGLGPAPVIAKMKSILTHMGAWAPMAEQKGLADYLPDTASIDRYLAHFKSEVLYRLTQIHDGLIQLKEEGFPIDAIAPEAAIYLTVKVDLKGWKKADGTVLADQADVTHFLLNEASLALVPFYAFGSDKENPWYRLSIGTCKKEEIAEMLGKLRSALSGLTKG
ncbi:MAG: pyridoxal phosphate-dependent aminotransferase [Bacteroidota bacterium]